MRRLGRDVVVKLLASELDARRLAQANELLRAAGDPNTPLADAVDLARARPDLRTRETPARAVTRLNAAFAANPVATARTVQAQAVLARVAGAADSAARRRPTPEHTRVRAELALSVWQGAPHLRLFRASDVAAAGGPATGLEHVRAAPPPRSAEGEGWADSARGFWTRYAQEPARDRNDADEKHLARVYRRLGALYASAGDVERASTSEARFVALWAQAEPALQPQVAAVRQRLVSRPLVGARCPCAGSSPSVVRSR